MKLTKYKLARIKQYLSEKDRTDLEEQLKEGKLKPETKSLIDKWLLRLAPKRLSKTRGAFGKRGTNRKWILFNRKIKFYKEAIEKQKEIELESQASNTIKKDGE